MNRIVYDHCINQKLTPEHALQYALDNGGKEGEYSHVKDNEMFHTKITFNDGSEIFFGKNAFTVSIT